MKLKFTECIVLATRIPKTLIYCQRGPNFGRGTAAKKLGEMAKNREIHCYAN